MRAQARENRHNTPGITSLRPKFNFADASWRVITTCLFGYRKIIINKHAFKFGTRRIARFSIRLNITTFTNAYTLQTFYRNSRCSISMASIPSVDYNYSNRFLLNSTHFFIIIEYSILHYFIILQSNHLMIPIETPIVTLFL